VCLYFDQLSRYAPQPPHRQDGRVTAASILDQQQRAPFNVKYLVDNIKGNRGQPVDVQDVADTLAVMAYHLLFIIVGAEDETV